MSSRRRGFPEEQEAPPPAKTVKKVKKSKKAKRKRLGILRALLRLIALWSIAVAIYSAVFVGVRCYSRTAPANVPLEAAADPVPGYSRPGASTYLGLPERVPVHSAGERAALLATSRPSRFPYFGAATQYWQYYASACAVTRYAYPFDAETHVRLATIGTAFTVGLTVRGVYEKTIGRFVEWVSSPDTPEDAFAQRTATEYAAFVQSAPWHRFAFWPKLRGVWQQLPIEGPHRIRKLERRLLLSVEYGVKLLAGWMTGQALRVTDGEDDGPIYARIDNAPASVFADARVKQVKPLGPTTHLVSLPHGAGFTAAALTLLDAGATFIDIAGNDQVLVTALIRRGVSTEIADARPVTVRPVLTDPTMQRLAVSVPVKTLRSVAAEIKRRGGVVEHLY